MVYKFYTTKLGAKVKIKLPRASLLIVTFIMSFAVYAEQNFKIKSIWYSNKSPREKSFLVVVEDRDHYYSGDKVLVFGNKLKDQTSIEYFTLFELNFYTSSGHEFKAMSDSHFLNGRVLLKNKMIRVNFEKSSSQSNEFIYKRVHTSNIDNFAKNYLFKIDNSKTISNITEFKRKLIRIKDLMGHILEDNHNYGVQIHRLQSEQEWQASASNSILASSTITASGQDPISRKYRLADRWSNESSVPSYSRYPISFYRSVTSGFTLSLLNKAAKRFVHYEIVNVRYLTCARERQRVKDYVWILKDGSTFQYSPYIECE